MSRRKRQSKRRQPPAKRLPTGPIAAVVVGCVVLVIAAVAGSRLMRSTAPRGSGNEPTNGAPKSDVTRDQLNSQEQALVIVSTDAAKARQADDERRLDPTQDGWDSEALADQAKHALMQLLSLLDPQTQIDRRDLATIVSRTFQCPPLRPEPLVELFRDETIMIRGQTETEPKNVVTPYAGTHGLRSALAKLSEPLKDVSSFHRHAKVVRVDLQQDLIHTSAIVELSGISPTGSSAVHAVWDCSWKRGADGALRLETVSTRDHQEVTARGGPQQTWFSDCTESVLAKNDSYREQILYGLNHWLSRVERVHGIHTFARCGLAVGDVNGDDLDDVYVCQPGGLPNRLYVQNPDGSATDRSEAAGLNLLDHTSSALLVDLDNDGDQDLVITTPTGLLVMANDATGKFQLKATLTPTDTDFMSLSACDFDGDNDLDLYACVEFPRRSATENEDTTPFVYHDANDGGANLLYRNDISAGGDQWQFTDVTRDVGLDVKNRRHSLAAAWEDFDNDGDQDLYVANDYGQNCLYRNDDGQFVEIAPTVDVVDFGSGMSVSWGDYNHDGWMDLYVANMFSSAGSRITRQRDFKPNEDPSTRAVYSRFAKGNSLFSNVRGKFQEVSQAAAVEMGRWAWSSLFADLNNDGWEDLFVANGYITTADTGDL